jgi:hypothetical protein
MPKFQTRQWARRAVFGIVRETGGQIIERPMFRRDPESGPTRDAEPVAGLRAARDVELAARFCARGCIRHAREAGHDWHEIRAALGIIVGGYDGADETIGDAGLVSLVGVGRRGRPVPVTVSLPDP